MENRSAIAAPKVLLPVAPSPLPARDVRGAATADGGPSPERIAKLRKAAQDFEAMAVGQLLAPMFNTVDTANGAFGGGAAEAAFKPMMVDAIAKQIASHGGLGLAAPVYASLLRAQETAANGRLR